MKNTKEVNQKSDSPNKPLKSTTGFWKRAEKTAISKTTPTGWLSAIERYGLPLIATVVLATVLGWMIKDDRQDYKIAQTFIIETLQKRNDELDERLDSMEDRLSDVNEELLELTEELIKLKYLIKRYYDDEE